MSKVVPALVFGAFLIAVHAGLATLCRPCMIRILEYRLRTLQSKNNEERNNEIALTQLFIAYHKQAHFDEVLPLLEKLSSIRRSISETGKFIYLYFADERFDELRQCNDYCVKKLDTWVEEHKANARQSLPLLKKLPDWNRYSYDYVTGDEAIELLHRVGALNGFPVRDWRDARVARKVLQWSSSRNDEPLRRAVRKMNLKRKPVHLLPLHFDSELTSRMGLLQADDKAFRAKVEKEIEEILAAEA